MGKQRGTKGDLLVGSVTVSTPGVTFGSAGMSLKCARVRLNCATTGLRTYGLSLNPGEVVLDTYIDVGTLETTASTKSVNVGVTGTTAGFLALASTASAVVVPGSLVAGSITKGSLLSEGTAASGRFSKPYISTASVALTSQCQEVQSQAVVDACVIYLAL